MKVAAITQVKTDAGKDLWKITLEGSTKPAWSNFSPPYKVGDEIPAELLTVNNKGNFVLHRGGKGETKPVSPNGEKPVSSERTYGKSKDEQESIKRQSARRDAVEIYKHCTSAEQPFARDLFEEYFGIMLLLGDAVVAEAVKLGGKIK